jgi:hypothetical protein
MNRTYLNPKVGDDERRSLLFGGAFFIYSARPSVTKLCAHAQKMISEAFSGKDPRKAQYDMTVADFIAAIGPLKSKFTNDAGTKELLREVLRDFGHDLDQTYFDVPRLRVVTSDKFLVSGVGYAYKAHRDIWYSSPESQINWWLPVYDLHVEQTLALYPHYWDHSIRNSSADFDYEEWCRVGRKLATSQNVVDTRKHPLPTEEVQAEDELRFILNSAETILFSAAHLHATVPNTSGMTRFSLDFRTVHAGDLENSRQAPNVDNACTGTTLGDFIRASDLAPVASKLIQQYARKR